MPPVADNPFLQLLGAELLEWRPGVARMRLALRPELANRTGRLQGGVLCTLLDAVAGYAGLLPADGAPPRRAVTLSLTTQFVASDDADAVEAEGRLTTAGRRIFFSEARVLSDRGAVLATALGSFRYLGD